MGLWLKFSSYGLKKLGIEPATPGKQGVWFIHHTKWAQVLLDIECDIQGHEERRGSVVECLTGDPGVTDSSLTGGTVLCP